MFSLQDIKDYWCVVSVNDDGDDARVMRISGDLNDDANLRFCNGVAVDDDTHIDQEWYDSWIEDESTVSGVYKLTLEPIYEEQEEGKEDEDEKVFDYHKVIAVQTLYVLEE